MDRSTAHGWERAKGESGDGSALTEAGLRLNGAYASFFPFIGQRNLDPGQFGRRMIADLHGWLAIAPRVNAHDRKQLLSTIAEVGARAFSLKAADIYATLSEREKLGSTGMGHGVAIPHGSVAGLERPRGVFARLETPVQFAAVDDEPVDLVFAILTPPGRGPENLRALARVSRLMRRARLRQQLRATRTIDGLRALLVEDVRPTAA